MQIYNYLHKQLFIRTYTPASINIMRYMRIVVAIYALICKYRPLWAIISVCMCMYMCWCHSQCACVCISQPSVLLLIIFIKDSIIIYDCFASWSGQQQLSIAATTIFAITKGHLKIAFKCTRNVSVNIRDNIALI